MTIKMKSQQNFIFQKIIKGADALTNLILEENSTRLTLIYRIHFQRCVMRLKLKIEIKKTILLRSSYTLLLLHLEMGNMKYRTGAIQNYSKNC